jgi:sn-glycerol 3-phosphate transport system substrate-binding protein
MMWTTTGNLTNVRANAKFDFGVAMLPANKRRGSPTGGGNFYLFKQAKPEQQAAALVHQVDHLARAPRNGASIPATSPCVPTRGTATMKQRRGFPAAAVARDQLQYAVAELSTHDNQ